MRNINRRVHSVDPNYHSSGPPAPAAREYRRKVTVSAVTFRPMGENTGGPPPLHHPTVSFQQPTPSCIRYTIFTHEIGNGLVTPLGSLVSVDSFDYLCSGSSHACFLLDNAIKK
ncbi:hypothetical protein EVAR_25510_1 [Eumeta japonica]|uniref:Uncharacterized protein n=1 Tax=Eumeta variegata TaxID=151549 RepID=A0A4C1VL21_EUMVA|nr:hypothetical protein EVAR_25510_1 [Eumeta japonica]